MKITHIALIGIIPFLFGCASTTVKTYSADFKMSPIETENVGKVIPTPDGEEYEIKQKYKFEGTIIETIKIDDTETISKEKGSLTVTASLGNESSVKIGPYKGISKGKPWSSNEEVILEVLAEEENSQLTAILKLTFKDHNSEPVICSQTITIQK